MSFVLPIDIFSYMLRLVLVPGTVGRWFPLGNLSVQLASMLSPKFSRDCNVVLAFLGEEAVVPHDCFQRLRASITNVDTCPPKDWNDVYDEHWVSCCLYGA